MAPEVQPYQLAIAGRQKQQFWMRLDNAAKIYPAVQSEELTAVFRLSCVLKERVKVTPLLEAIRKIEDRFPYYKVKAMRLPHASLYLANGLYQIPDIA